MRTVWLIRHGESESNAGRSSADPGESTLTELGRRQAERIACAMAAPPALIVTSPFRRTGQTARPTITRFPTARCEEWPVQEFTYLGDLHGRVTSPEERRPRVEAYWAQADPHESSGGAESFAELIGRARACLDRLAAQPAGPVAVFTHGMFIRAVVWSLLTGVTTPDHRAMRAFHQFDVGFAVPNGSVAELRYPDRGTPQLVGGHIW